MHITKLYTIEARLIGRLPVRRALPRMAGPPLCRARGADETGPDEPPLEIAKGRPAAAPALRKGAATALMRAVKLRLYAENR
jgi:hypothetical protein